MLDVISEAALFTYSFIIQSNVSLPLTVTHGLHLSLSLPHSLPPHHPTKSDKPEPLIHAASFH